LTSGEQPPEDESRREFLKVAATISAGLAIAGIASVVKPVIFPAIQSSGVSEFPKVKISSLAELTTGTVVLFNYPLDNEPNLLIKLGTKAQGGVGPDSDIVAFSQICQHLGCQSIQYVQSGSSPTCKSSYEAAGPIGYCCCHGSVYDFANGATVVGGPAPRPLPQVALEVDSSGDIYATGMGPPSIFGHDTGSDDVTNDLSGGNLVTQT
jgi:arsenite oxidase small subunit